MLKKWADPSGDRGNEIDAKTLYPDLWALIKLRLNCQHPVYKDIRPNVPRSIHFLNLNGSSFSPFQAKRLHLPLIVLPSVFHRSKLLFSNC